MSEPSASDEIVVSVRAVGKVYRLYDHPQDRLKHMLFSRVGKSYGHEFWALRDVSFDVRRGEVVGIIGRNGSGKSTLLQIMAGILQPAAGEVRLRGRVGALLELGSGFNLDCTGRENVFLNAAILGMSRREIARRVDEIVAFADIGEFIDQPVKMYSSGMFVRLAFAVTTSLDADVLLIDEALAVGDVFFRQKCYQRLATLRERGVAIVLVSHALNEVEQFCQRALLLHGGHVIVRGAGVEAVKRYYLHRAAGPPRRRSRADAGCPARAPRTGVRRRRGSLARRRRRSWTSSGVAQVTNGGARCTALALCDGAGRPRRVFEQGETASFFYEFELLADIEVPTGGCRAGERQGHHRAWQEHARVRVRGSAQRRDGAGRLRFRQDVALELAGGEYTFNLGLGALARHDYDRRARTSYAELDARLARLCLLPRPGTFAVALRPSALPSSSCITAWPTSGRAAGCPWWGTGPLAAEPGAAAGAHGAPVADGGEGPFGEPGSGT